MTNLALFESERIVGRAIFAGQRLNLYALEKTQRIATSPLVLGVGNDGVAVFFRFGVVVTFGITAIEEAALMEKLAPFIVQPFTEHEVEEVILLLAPGDEEHVGAKGIVLSSFDITKLQIIAQVLAKSVILAHYETTLSKTFDRIEPLASKLQTGGRFTHQGRELLSHIGDVLMIQVKTVGRVEVSEKPELLWERPQYERLHATLSDYYELVERHAAIERKLELISTTAETLLELLQNKRSLRVEWYIVILILVDILLSVYKLLTP